MITLLRVFSLNKVLYVEYAKYALQGQPFFGTVTYGLEQLPLIKWTLCFYNKHFRLVKYTTFC